MREKILNYWFDYPRYSAPFYDRALWWEKNDKTDRFIENEFGEIRQKAIKGELNDWLASPKGVLAYVILIDQFSRNIYRGHPEAFQHDELARTAVKQSIAKGEDKSLLLTERVFLYLPLEHSEDQQDQQQSVALFEGLYEDAPLEAKEIANAFLMYAKQHQEIINQFNRFPHRNNLLNRVTSPEEEVFLRKHPGF